MIPKVSILVPVYGVEKFIERCAVSLFEQTLEDIEFIFVNDCTQDNSINILISTLERYPNRKSQVRIVNHEFNKGLAGSRNTGIENAIGSFILHVDSDDYLEFNACELLYNEAIKLSADIVICNITLRWENVSKVIKQNIPLKKEELLNKMLCTGLMPGVVNKLFKRSLFVENNISAIEGINMGEDYITTPRLIYFSNKVAHLDVPLYNYIQYNSEAYTKVINMKSCQDIVKGFDILDDFFKTKTDFSIYERSIKEGKLIKKIELIERVPAKYMTELCLLFSRFNYDSVQNLSYNQRIILYLYNRKQYFLMRCYLSVYKIFYSIVQILKRR